MEILLSWEERLSTDVSSGVADVGHKVVKVGLVCILGIECRK